MNPENPEKLDFSVLQACTTDKHDNQYANVLARNNNELLFWQPLILSLSIKPYSHSAENTATTHSYSKNTQTHAHIYPKECTQTQQSVAEVQSGPAAVTLFTVKIWGIQSPCILPFKAPLGRNVHTTDNSQRECLWVRKNCCDTANKCRFLPGKFQLSESV